MSTDRYPGCQSESENLHHLPEVTCSLSSLALSLFLFFFILPIVHSVTIAFSDMLPKVETRVVLVGEACRNGALVKALQVHHPSLNPPEGTLWSTDFYHGGRLSQSDSVSLLFFDLISRTWELCSAGQCFWVITVSV